MVGQGRLAPISVYNEFRGMPGGIEVEKGHQSPLPRPPPHDASDPLSPPSPAGGWGGRQRQRLSLRLGGRTPRFLAPPHAYAPVSLVTQKGGGSREREGEKVCSELGGAGQAGVVMKLVSFPRWG